jgi:hypothetical protein
MDPIEQDDVDGVSQNQSEGWLPWDLDDLIDIKRIIDERMPFKQKQVLEGFLAGMSFTDRGMTEKYWRYHYDKAVEFIQEELGE